MKNLFTILFISLFIFSCGDPRCIEGNCSYGQGTYTFSNGDKYVGEFKDDLRNGQGTYTFSNGNKYVGEWKDGKMNGQGTYTYSNGQKYVGEWKDDRFLGNLKP